MIWLPGVLSQGGKKYVWERYTLTKVVVTGGTRTGSISIGSTTSYGTGYTFDENTGNFTITGAKTGHTDEYADMGVGSVTYHDSHSNNYVYELGKKTFTTIYEWTITSVTSSNVSWNSKALTSGQGKGTLIDTVVSSNTSDYPQNGEKDGYWYVFIGVDSGGSDTPDVPPGVNYVDYIQSTGTQFLDTEYVPNANTRVEMTFQLTTPDSTNQAIFGVVGQFSFRWYGSGSRFRTNGSNNVDFATTIDATAKHTVVKTATQTTIDGTHSANTTAGNVTLSLYLFGQHVAAGLQNPAKLKMWGCKIYESNVLVHDYRPCLDPDGVACMYDEVNKEYVHNSGTGEFVTGVVSGSINYVDYIQSDGTQYIDTGFKPNSNTRVTMDFYMNDGVESSTRYIFGARTGTGSLRYDFLWSSSAAAYTSLFFNGSTSQGYILDGVSAAGRHFVDKNKRVTTLDNASVTSTNSNSFTAEYSMYIGSTNQEGSALAGLPGRIYSCKIYDNDVLVRDYRPCLDPDGVACMYDEVNSEYVYNAGSGTFAYGMAA